MPRTALAILALACCGPLTAQTAPAPRVVTTGLAGPWEITWGPDDHLWLTERIGKRIVRVNPDTGAKATLLTLEEVHQDAEQDGLLGLALHPRLLRGTDANFVYIFFTYDVDPGAGVLRKGKVRRYTYNAKAAALENPTDLLSGLPVHNDHVSGRLAFGAGNKLYLSIGDQGSNFGRNACNPNRAQETPTAAEVSAKDWTKYQGKLLRINLDGSVPGDNPVIAGVRSHIYSYGHRNIQGIAFGPDGKVYTAEHGPSTDDEVNFIQAGRNYGWPNVAGYKDGKAYAYANWSAASGCPSLRFNAVTAPPEVPQQPESAFSNSAFTPPIATFFTVDSAGALRNSIGTAALSGLHFYGSNAIAGWANSLLVTSLKLGKIYRLKLNAKGDAVAGDPIELFPSINRYRDIAISPDGRRIFVSADVQGRVTIAPGNIATELANPGTILEFQQAK
jgi:PQQ-dependent dehydrogenase (s-GDH family)